MQTATSNVKYHVQKVSARAEKKLVAAFWRGKLALLVQKYVILLGQMLEYCHLRRCLEASKLKRDETNPDT